ncbi:MAG TPA: ribosomal protein L7/L12 [Casimicrobiaceae bacterium]|jgi:ribosomal protein L7/L12
MDRPHNALPAEVIDALRRGNAIEAIKLLRAKGIGLGDAKARIEAHLRGFATPGAAQQANRALPPDAARALARGDKIEAIKLARAETGLGLKEAKDWVDAQAATPQMPTGLAPGEVPRHEGFGLWIVVIVLIVAAAYFLVFRGG